MYLLFLRRDSHEGEAFLSGLFWISADFASVSNRFPIPFPHYARQSVVAGVPQCHLVD